MSALDQVSALDIVAVQKSPGVAFLDAVFDAYEAGQCIALVDPLDSDVPGMRIVRRVAPQTKGGWYSRRLHISDRNSDDIAQISLTSGTTGTPKAVALSQRALQDVSDRLVRAMEMTGNIREYVGAPVTFSFGLGRVRAITDVGGKAYVPEAGFQPGEFGEMLARGEVNALSVVPTQLRLLLANPDLFASAAGALRWMEIGSQYLSAEEKQHVRTLFPNAVILQHYGLTEASRSTFLRIDGAPGSALESVGSPTGRVEVRIGAGGHVEIRGPHVASGLLTERGLTPLTDADGWLRTNDLGFVRNGLLHYQGRSDDQINIGGIKVGAEHLERLLIERTQPGEIAVAARDDALRGEAVSIFRTPGTIVPDQALRLAADDILQSMGIRAGMSVLVVPIDAIPRTPTGKVQRNLLRDRAPSQALPAAAGKPSDADAASPLEAELIAIWEDALGIRPIGRNQSFFDVGGDSLSAISIMIRMERLGIDRRVSQQIFEGRTIAEIASDAPASDNRLARMAEAINITRGLLALWVVAIHWLPFFYERMGALHQPLMHWSNPFFRFGTPGFAMIFGVGLGFFHLHVFSRSPSTHVSRTLRNAALLAAGILIGALFLAIEALVEDGTLGRGWPTRLFYSVLLFYCLMVATAPAFLWLLHKSKQKVLAALALSVAFFALSLLARHYFGDMRTTGFANLARLAIIANYGYLELGGSVFLGAAAGIALREHHTRDAVARMLVQAGLILSVWGVVISVSTGATAAWFQQSFVTQPMLVTYAGFVSILLGVTYMVNMMLRETPARVIIRIVAVIGILALLMFVAHAAVIPLKSILAVLGLADGTARVIAVLVFLVVMTLAVRQTYRRYYA